uniref:Uncharacterized protein n=1 Tax=Salvator merianae TaxID=96440 RepID=A0A8D0E9R3_SALMN
VFVYLMCGPRQLFFQCVPEMPKGWTLLPSVGDHKMCSDLWYPQQDLPKDLNDVMGL